jgi:hypothetical protein
MRVNKMITITVEQAKWLEDHNLRLSLMVQKMLDKEMQKESKKRN